MTGGEISLPVMISLATFAVLTLSSVGALVWKLSRIELALRSEYTADATQIRAEHARELAVLSAKLYQVEIWSRDEFVRKGSFEIVIARMEGGFRDLRAEITGRLDTITSRLGVPH